MGIITTFESSIPLTFYLRACGFRSLFVGISMRNTNLSLLFLRHLERFCIPYPSLDSPLIREDQPLEGNIFSFIPY